MTPQDSKPSGPPSVRAGARSWVPIRSLSPRHRDRITRHLLDLPERDRYLRFGYAASDAQIRQYAQQLDFERDELFGIFNRRLRMLAMAHLAYFEADRREPCAEFGVSVAAGARGRGYGKRLFDLAALHARNRGVQSLLIHALSENIAMLRIARHAGADLVREGGESRALLKLPADTLGSQVEELFESGAAEWNYRLKQQARRMERLLASLAALSATERSAPEPRRDRHP